MITMTGSWPTEKFRGRILWYRILRAALALLNIDRPFSISRDPDCIGLSMNSVPSLTLRNNSWKHFLVSFSTYPSYVGKDCTLFLVEPLNNLSEYSYYKNYNYVESLKVPT